ncbi:MerR family transcriptional regulator [uncultured Enterococcus sp.]|uniref:MerR family transcriptional regulator n=1 Tax=uncultured Enterococcus sp. TaxID=167972 RepID=UPI002AA7E624|nr:MerR family transcriptional regulator [uncultured Enterococcus sp.]
MFKIGEFSKISNTTVRTLRHYEKLGLLLPTTVDQQSGYRFYEASQISTINKIKMLQQIGLSLDTIKEILEKQQVEILNYYYEAKENELEQEMEALKKKKEMIRQLQNQLKEGKNMEKYNVVLKSIPARSVISVRKVIPSFQDEGMLWGLLQKEIEAEGVKIVPGSLGVSLYHDKEYKESEVDVEVQLEVSGEYENGTAATFFEAPEYNMASVTFSGSFDQMPQISQALGTWIETNHYQVSGPMINISHVSPAQDSNPENWVTEASFVISPRP